MLSACGGGGGGSSAVQPTGSTGGGTPPPGGGGTGGTPPATASVDIIKGRITGFGSVFIDGQRFDTADATFSKDDEDVTEDDLAVGMVVEIQGDISAGMAMRVDFEEDIKGPVDSISGDLTELTVLGQVVLIGPDTVIDDSLDLSTLVAGDLLEVSGFRGSDDVLQASYIEQKLAGEVSAYKVIGQIRDLDNTAQSFRIGQLLIDYSVAELDDGVVLSAGNTVEVKDESLAYSPGAFTLLASKVEPAGLGLGGDQDRDDEINIGVVQLEGLISFVHSANQFELAGTLVNHDDNTRFEFGDASRLAVGTKVEVEGTLNSDGVLQAREIEFADNSARLDGLVGSIDLASPALTILGVQVDLGTVRELEDSRDDIEPFQLEDILPGDFLEIRGNSTGVVLYANEIERDDEDDTRVRGPAENIDAGTRTLTILGVSIITNASTQYQGFADEALTADSFFALLAEGQTLVDAQWQGVVTDSTIPVEELSLED